MASQASYMQGQHISFLGRPAVRVQLDPDPPGKRPRTEEAEAEGEGDGGAGSGGGQKAPRPDRGAAPLGSARQAGRQMLRARRLGVAVPAVLAADPRVGALVLAVPQGCVPLRDLLTTVRTQQQQQEGGGGPAEAEAAGEAAGPGPGSAGGGGGVTEVAAAAAALGRALAALHDGGQVHGRLGGGSVLWRAAAGQVVLVDWAHSTNTIAPGDKATDLAGLEAELLQRQRGRQGPAGPEAAEGGEAGAELDPALVAELFSRTLDAYRAASRNWSAVHNRVAEARAKAAGAQKQQIKQAKQAARQKGQQEQQEPQEQQREEGEGEQAAKRRREAEGAGEGAREEAAA